MCVCARACEMRSSVCVCARACEMRSSVCVCARACEMRSSVCVCVCVCISGRGEYVSHGSMGDSADRGAV